MYFGMRNVQELRYKPEIIRKDIEQIKLDFVTLTETKKKESGLWKVTIIKNRR